MTKYKLPTQVGHVELGKYIRVTGWIGRGNSCVINYSYLCADIASTTH